MKNLILLFSLISFVTILVYVPIKVREQVEKRKERREQEERKRNLADYLSDSCSGMRSLFYRDRQNSYSAIFQDCTGKTQNPNYCQQIIQIQVMPVLMGNDSYALSLLGCGESL